MRLGYFLIDLLCLYFLPAHEIKLRVAKIIFFVVENMTFFMFAKKLGSSFWCWLHVLVGVWLRLYSAS
jgi:hypothetical protein